LPDVIVVGAGHNGLTAACYLARAGHDVLVLEANAKIGGCTTTTEIPGAPGFETSPCAGDVITLRGSTIVDDLDLVRHGYVEVDVDPCYMAITPDGASLAFWRDPRRTAEEIKRFSQRDARTFLALMEELDHALDAMLPMMQTNPTRPDPKVALAVAKAVARHPKHVGQLAQLLTGSAAQALRERFEHPIVRGAFAMLCSFGSPITIESSGANLMVLPLISRIGLGRPLGGLGKLPEALAADLTEHRGRIRTDARVAEIVVTGGRAGGVRLTGGETLTAAAVITACDPRTALTQLLPKGALSAVHEARAAAIPVLNDGCTHFRVDVALDQQLQLPRHSVWRGDDLDLRKPSHMIGDLDTICDAIADAKGGRVPDPMPVVSIISSSTDPDSAPDGGDVLYLWSGWTPHHPPAGWDTKREPVADALVARAAEHYSGIEEHTITRRVESWMDISARTNVPDGNVYHVDLSVQRTGALRPALGFGGYKTPVDGLFLTGAGTHPGPSVSGIPGQQAARVVLKNLNQKEKHVPRHPAAGRSGAEGPRSRGRRPVRH
jgi:phytoene dehydrogenase-like protein